MLRPALRRVCFAPVALASDARSRYYAATESDGADGRLEPDDMT